MIPASAFSPNGPFSKNPTADDLKIIVFPYSIPRHYWKKHARRKFIKELEERSDNLCWACTAYFDFDKKGIDPPYETIHRWREKNNFGDIEAIKTRAQACACCSFLTKCCERLEVAKGRISIEMIRGGYQIMYDQKIEPLYLANLSEPVRAKDVHVVDSSAINLKVVKSWFDNCQQEHGPGCKGYWASLWQGDRPDMRIVDVQQMTLLWPAPRDCEYAVLSYVWGGVQKIRIDNSARARIDLRPIHRNLPQTIKDAITVTKHMGLKYLWVDNLCIQARFNGRSEAAREKDRNKQFNNMHKIYGMAQFCIVAAQGNSANDGLWRMSRRSQEEETIPHPQPRHARPSFASPARVEINEGAILVQSMKLPEDIKQSTWTRRAWCLQEQLFSVRYLVFYDNQVWFQCKKGMWFEDMPLELKSEYVVHQDHNSKAERRYWNEVVPKTEFSVPCRITEMQVDVSRLYSRSSQVRSETQVVYKNEYALVVRSVMFKEYQSIVLLYTEREMTHASDALRAANGLLSVIEDGMKTSMLSGLPESMLDAALLWKGEESLQFRDPDIHVHLPSWSWAGWKGRVMYEPIKEFRNRGRRFAEVDQTSEEQGLYPENLRPFLRWSKTGNVLTDGAEYEMELVNGTGTGILHRGRCPQDWNMAARVPEFEPAYQKCPTEKAWQPDHLHTWTMQSSRFKLQRRSSSPQYKHLLAIDSDSTEVIGELWLDTWDLRVSRLRSAALIVISEAQFFSDQRLNEDADVYNWPNLFLLYNVLLVQFIEGVAVREGIGRVSKRGWGRIKPEWRFIRLG
jgi:hypothetical protein